MRRFERKSNVDSVQTVEVLLVKSIIGAGVEDDPIRGLTEVFTLDGKLLARHDTLRDTLDRGVWHEDES